MRKSLIAAACGTILLTGCATNDYRMYAETQAKIAQAQAQSDAMKETARYAALAEIAKQGDSAAKVAAVMSINFSNGAGATNAQRPIVLNAPKTWGDTALQWTSVLLPSLTNLYGISANRQVAVTQSNNQAAVAMNTNNTFASMNSSGLNTANSIASTGFTAVGNVANTGLSSVVNVANTGSNNLLNLSTNHSNAMINLNNTHANVVNNLANTIPNLQPNITTNTTTTTTNNAP